MDGLARKTHKALLRLWAALAMMWIALAWFGFGATDPILPNVPLAFTPMPNGSEILSASAETRDAAISAYVSESSAIRRARTQLTSGLFLMLAPPLLLLAPLLLPYLLVLGRTRLFTSIGRHQTALWSLWAIASLAWISTVWITAPMRPTSDDLRLLASNTRPPLSEFLTDPAVTCEFEPNLTRTMQIFEDRRAEHPMPPSPNPSHFAVLEDYNAAFALWERDVYRVNLNRRLDTPPPETWHCHPGPYTEALNAHHTATRPWRAASARLNIVFWPAIAPPVIAFTIGLFLFWPPFRRR